MNLANLEKNLDISFKNKNLLREALTHRSYLNEHPKEKLSSNERLEFLGDAVLEFVASQLLFEEYPQAQEGLLTSLRSRIVCTRNLSQLAQKFALGDFLLLSKGEEESGGRQNPGLLENAFEATMGAIFLDQGLRITWEFVKKHFLRQIQSLAGKNLKDCKSLLQEKIQEELKITPSYKVLKEEGPDHAKIFTVGVFLEDKFLERGEGRSKQEAEEEAAKKALEKYHWKKVKSKDKC